MNRPLPAASVAGEGNGRQGPPADGDVVIDMRKVATRFGAHVVHSDINLEVRRREVFAVIGGSGSGKSTLLREMILLQRPDAGSIRVLGVDLQDIDDDAALALRQRWGVMFQKGGLFSALTVGENVGLPLREHGRLHGSLSDELIDGIAAWKLALTGLAPDVVLKYPDALSGGMLKRAALARALALDPELLILDEPTSGLDPASAAGIGTLIQATRQQFGPTIVIISHDLELLWRVPDRVAVLGEGKVLAIGPMAELARHPHPIVAAYFADTHHSTQETAWKAN